jgi:hypothetical protein
MAKALELLRDQPAAAGVMQRFTAWVDAVMMPQMDFYSDEVTPVNLALGTKHLYGAWGCVFVMRSPQPVAAVGWLPHCRKRLFGCMRHEINAPIGWRRQPVSFLFVCLAGLMRHLLPHNACDIMHITTSCASQRQLQWRTAGGALCRLRLCHCRTVTASHCS